MGVQKKIPRWLYCIPIPEWKCATVLVESNTPTPPHPKPLIIKDVPANKERWGMGCDITV